MKRETLDCGHPPDDGSPAQIMKKNGQMEIVQGWTFVLLDDGRKVCHKCADERILDCGHKPSPHAVFTTGYGTDSNGKTSCYACCAETDKLAMVESGRATLYLSGNVVTNWPGSLKMTASVRRGRHNIAGSRYDAWFTGPDGKRWHGTQYGENTQICHCRRIKD